MGGGRGPYCPAWWQVMASELQGDSEISRTRSRQDLPRDAAEGQVENVANGAGHTKNSHLLQSAKPWERFAVQKCENRENEIVGDTRGTTVHRSIIRSHSSSLVLYFSFAFG